MKHKGVLLVICIIITLFSIACASANDTDYAAGASSLIEIETCEIEPQPTSQDTDSSFAELLASGNDGTFTDLANEIAGAGDQLNLTRNYVFSEGDKDEIPVNKIIEINGNGYTIDGNNQAKGLHVYACDVVLKNIKFVNYNTGYYDWLGGSALYIDKNADNGVLSNCSFINCSSWEDGGAVGWQGNKGTILDCSFINCQATNGGGAIYWCSDDGIISNCSFINCYSDGWGGGGAITFMNSNDCNLSGCSFTNCSSWYFGGAVNWDKTSSYTSDSSSNNIISDCSFVNCSVLNAGGAVFWHGDNGIIAGSSFDSCSANHGGAVYWEGDNGIIDNCRFVNDHAVYTQYDYDYYTTIGGAIVWSEVNTNGVTSNCSFVNCSSLRGGGAIHWSSPTYPNNDSSVMYGCSFENCSADLNGGAVYWSRDDGYVVESEFKNCRAEYGGGIYFECANSNLIASTFEGNAAKNGQNWYSKYNLNVINETPKTNMPTFLRATYINTVYGNFKNLTVTLKDIKNNALSEKNVTIALNNVKHTLKTDSKGQASIPTDGLIPEEYIAEVSFAGDDTYNPSKTAADVIIHDIKTYLAVELDGYDIVANLTDDDGNPIPGRKIAFGLNGVTYITSDDKGQAKYSVRDLDGTYVIKVIAFGDEIYGDSNQEVLEFTITKIATKLTAKYDKDSKNIVATVKDASGNPVSGLKVGFAINGMKYALTDENGQASYSTENLSDNTYTAKVMAYGNERYKDSNKETVTFTIANHEQSKIYLRNALYFALQTKYVTVTLWDANNNPIANKTVHIRLNDNNWTYSGVTDENGNA